MRVPLSWLQDFVDLDVSPEDDAAVASLAGLLDSLGLVVESTERIGVGLDGVVAAEVAEIAAIAGADRIRRVRVEAGETLGSVEVVCGAWNFEVGDLVPLAPVGTRIPTGLLIERRRLRGVYSEGMLCSGHELGLSEDSGGLLVLSRHDGDVAEKAVGRPIAELLGIEADVVFDLGIEPNRPDCLSVLGIARDLAAALARELHVHAPVVAEAAARAEELAGVSVAAREDCRQLVGRVLLDLGEFPSTRTMQRRLELCGVRPVNAVVDASNYAMLELGQPSHPYDLDLLAGQRISVRRARAGERLVTLDESVHDLLEGELVIVDGAEEPVGLAGVMGGAASKITAGTRRVLLEVAEFEPLVVGRQAARHNLRTEAMLRYWRGIDPLGLERCADRVCELVQESARAAGASVPLAAAGVVTDRPRAYEPRQIVLEVSRVNALLGTELSGEEIAHYLEAIGFVVRAGATGLVVEPPSFRPDVGRDVDCIEEVARHYGYANIPARTRRSPYVGQLSAPQSFRRSLLAYLQGAGASEAWTASVVDATGERLAGSVMDRVSVLNPIVAGENALRTHLLPGLLRALLHNEHHRNGFVRLFELGKVFAPLPDARGVAETEQLGVILARQDDDARTAVELSRGLVEAFGIAPGAIELAQDLAGVAARPEPIALGLHPARAATLMLGETAIGAVGEIDPEVLAAFGLEERRIGWLVVDTASLASAPRRPLAAAAVSKYPSGEIDLAFVLPEDRAAGELAAAYRGERRAAARVLCPPRRLPRPKRAAGYPLARLSTAVPRVRPHVGRGRARRGAHGRDRGRRARLPARFRGAPKRD